MTPIAEQQKNKRCEEARLLGAEAARNAASCLEFVDEDQACELQRFFKDGDWRAYVYLPSHPSLSGDDWTDDPTPRSLAEHLLGDDHDDATDEEPELIDWLADAWEKGVSETWNDAIEARIKAYLDE